MAIPDHHLARFWVRLVALYAAAVVSNGGAAWSQSISTRADSPHDRPSDHCPIRFEPPGISPATATPRRRMPAGTKVPGMPDRGLSRRDCRSTFCGNHPRTRTGFSERRHRPQRSSRICHGARGPPIRHLGDGSIPPIPRIVAACSRHPQCCREASNSPSGNHLTPTDTSAPAARGTGHSTMAIATGIPNGDWSNVCRGAQR